jgi:hypothetical protein
MVDRPPVVGEARGEGERSDVGQLFSDEEGALLHEPSDGEQEADAYATA